ncbi:sigma-70 family RNA polymerase sigma factor [Singulisphaera acidiphila]|uniref:RNA polymerase sigma factor, sigma-70 family n=1 Tax=Singulisphaera acidiphila (strain ATCC BAA-1392 / DSM 18658 / VKM B-2454 / MOB10) TaxID=886293 RepID=L0DFL9_SINAD|nr:sigma-70 family RNA polymerase sigma factor [Singulisphaera acidiphila]AGA27446.1 RNA polymerase sigma factor, sigma-70 family [Singulisphaera acidiphila DSM 18658]
MPSINANSWFLEQVQKDQARLRAYVRSLGVRAEWVDDLAQEALLIALRRVDEFDRTGDFGGWVRQIARRLIANERRKAMRRDIILSDHATDILLEIHGESPKPGELQEREEEIAKLRECVSGLPKRSRELLQQRYFEDLSPGAIGSRLGLPSNQIRQTLLRLRRVLLTCMERRSGTHIA